MSGTPDPTGAASAAASPLPTVSIPSATPSWLDRLKQQGAEKKKAKNSVVDEAAAAEARRREAFELRMSAPGMMDGETYEKIVSGLAWMTASTVKDRLARSWDATVTSLTLAYAVLSSREVDLLAKTLISNHVLTYLDLGWNDMDEAGVGSLSAALRTGGALQSLRLWNNPRVGDEGATHIAGMLKGNTTLTALDLSITGITSSGASALNGALLRNTTLTMLVLNRNGLGDAGVSGLLQQKEGCMFFLQTLSLCSVGFGDVGAVAAAEFIRTSFTLSALDISWNQVKYAGIDLIGAALTANKSLTSMDLSGNRFGPAGAITMASHINNCRFLRELNLAHNGMEDDGVGAFVGNMRLCRQLLFLDLTSNLFTERAGKLLGYILRETQSLRRLRVSENNLGFVGIMDVAESIRRNTTLTALDVTGNNLTPHGAVQLRYAMQRNKRFADW